MTVEWQIILILSLQFDFSAVIKQTGDVTFEQINRQQIR